MKHAVLWSALGYLAWTNGIVGSGELVLLGHDDDTVTLRVGYDERE
jgi:hypothetical protein